MQAERLCMLQLWSAAEGQTMVGAIYPSSERGSLPQASKTPHDVKTRDTRNREDDQIYIKKV